MNGRDLIAGLAAAGLVFAGLSLATSLHDSRRGRRKKRDAETDRGRRVIAELPVGEDLTLFCEDDTHFFYGATAVDKAAIKAARVLINGSAIAAVTAVRSQREALQPTAFEDRPEGIARDRWDVALETDTGTVLVECGAIRERISQELARAIFAVVKAAVEGNDAATRGGATPDPTTPSREHPPGD